MIKPIPITTQAELDLHHEIDELATRAMRLYDKAYEMQEFPGKQSVVAALSAGTDRLFDAEASLHERLDEMDDDLLTWVDNRPYLSLKAQRL